MVMNDSEQRFAGQVVIVTGPGRGIGRAIAKSFASERATVLLAELDPVLLDKTASEIKADGGNVDTFRTDVTDRSSVKHMVETAIARHGVIDVLVNNVGGGPGALGVDITPDDWEFGLRMNLTGTFNCCAEVVPHMVKRKRGKIVNISSSAARFMSRYFATMAYVAAKGGVSALTRQLAWHLGGDGINVNAVEPGHVWTELTEEQWPSFPDELKERIISEIPMGRMCKPQEIADAVLFLASSDAGFMTGSAIEVNGALWLS
jgi:NAD(P)-dependent dehydrogenase (short-subunit alcohol dehydrogenase family)